MAEAKEELVVNDRIKELADKIKAGINFNKETAVGTEESNGSLYWANLPEGLTKKVVKEVNNYDNDFVAASAKAAGEIAIEAMTGDTKLEQANFELGMGYVAKVKHTVDRQKEYPDFLSDDKDPKTVVKKGHLTTRVSTTISKGTRGQLKVVRQLLNKLAEEKLK